MAVPVLLCATALNIVGSSIVMAQPGPSTPASTVGDRAEQEAVVETITVTAQRREQNLQDIPISAEVLGGEALTRQNINGLGDLSVNLPSVHVGPNSRSEALFIRGIGSGDNQSFDQSVGTFIDDIYHGRSRSSTATFLDIDRLEVLKGPQSTFFGNNAIAGAFNIVTKKPGHQFEANARALYGSARQYTIDGGVGGPLSDKIAVRGAATFNGMSGWIENVNLQRDEPRVRNMAGRLIFLFEPSDDLEATLKVEGGKNKTTGTTFQMADCPPPAPFTPRGFCAVQIAQGLPTGIDNNKNADSYGEVTKLNTAEAVLTLAYERGGAYVYVGDRISQI